uniref:Wall-associated receptor kinase-like 5 isoform X1 n=1 Tax=Rhizophora mucronata TaxID=61149 RepID=A0A2P2MFI1_RHIMU
MMMWRLLEQRLLMQRRRECVVIMCFRLPMMIIGHLVMQLKVKQLEEASAGCC